MPTLIMWQNRFSENENETVEAYIPQHQDSKTKKPPYRDSETKKLWHRDSGTETPRNKETEKNKPLHRDSKALFQSTKSHDIKIPQLKKHYIEISRPKVGTSGSCGILTIMPPWYLLNLERKNYDSNEPNQISYKHDLSNNVFDLQSHDKTAAASRSK